MAILSRFILVSLITAALAGCTGAVTWNKPSMTTASLEADNVACGAAIDASGRTTIAEADLLTYEACMKKKGYAQTARTTPTEVARATGEAVGRGLAEGITGVDQRSTRNQGELVMSTAGLEPVGPISKPGCAGIEVIGYATTLGKAIDNNYYMTLRNNGSIARIVAIYFRGGPTVLGTRHEGMLNIKMGAGEIEQFHVDYSENAPERVEVTKCL